MNRIANLDLQVHSTSFACYTETSPIISVGQMPCKEWGTHGTTEGVKAGYQWRIQLCPTFFSRWASHSSCHYSPPGRNSYYEPDQGAVLLHALLHNAKLFEDLPWKPIQIKDGILGTCYSPKLITDQASGTTDIPMCGDLLTVASTYQYYALAVYSKEDKNCGGPGSNGTIWENCLKSAPDW